MCVLTVWQQYVVGVTKPAVPSYSSFSGHRSRLVYQRFNGPGRVIGPLSVCPDNNFRTK